MVEAAEKPELKELITSSRFVDDLGHSDDDHHQSAGVSHCLSECGRWRRSEEGLFSVANRLFNNVDGVMMMMQIQTERDRS